MFYGGYHGKKNKNENNVTLSLAVLSPYFRVFCTPCVCNDFLFVYQ